MVRGCALARPRALFAVGVVFALCPWTAMPDLTKKVKTYWFDPRTDLPQWIATGIGQTVAEWSLLERELEEIIRILMNGETQQTRILTHRMNVRTREITIKAFIDAHILRRTLQKRHRR